MYDAVEILFHAYYTYDFYGDEGPYIRDHLDLRKDLM